MDPTPNEVDFQVNLHSDNTSHHLFVEDNCLHRGYAIHFHLMCSSECIFSKLKQSGVILKMF